MALPITPGPWFVGYEQESGSLPLWFVADINGNKIAENIENEADARAIAQVPDLLEQERHLQFSDE
jgi:hypothetical protein